jgi:hypothetical protein
MNDTPNKEMESLRKLIDLESDAALDRFQCRDFQTVLAKRLQEGVRLQPVPWFRHPAYLVSGLAAVLVLAVLITVISPYLEVKRDLRELKEILMRVPEMRTPIPALYPSPVDEETKQLIALSWIFKRAEDRLNPRELSVAEVRSLLENALSAPGPEQVFESRLRQLSREELLLLEKKIRALIAAGELQRRRQRDGSDHL